MNQRTVLCPLILVVSTWMIGGCHVTGPAAVKTGRASYNVAIQQTNSEQLLLNLVRLRYRDPPYFLEVASVSTSFTFTASASAGASLPESPGAADNTYDVAAGLGYAERPTVTYTPLAGETFVKQLMSPIDLSTLVLLYHSGWSIERIFCLTLQSINGVKNAPSASGPTPSHVPKYRKFHEVVSLLRALQLRGALEIGQAAAEQNGESAVELRIAKDALDSDEATQLYELLGLERGRTHFRLTRESGTGDRTRLAVVPRSLMSTLFYVSQSVEIPASDERAGRVTVTRDEQGQAFDWRQVTGGLIRVRSAALPPANAYVAVYYRGSWFYISDSNLTAKSTFSLLLQLFALQAGDVKTTGPVLTLSVDR